MEHPSRSSNPRIEHRKSRLGNLIFLSRWLQLPIYLGLIVVQGVYAYKFLHALWEMMSHLPSLTETEIMLSVLGLIDVAMIANLLLMVTVGGYETFVSRLRIDEHPDQPEWLDHVNASVLKVKLSMAIISISSIHLLQTFINVGDLPEHTVKWQLLLHLAFLLSAMAIAYTDRLLTQAHRA
ncbi:TIGR00645 family protein [Paludibacterium yongneupense]|uniref:TIGR00645 family protein n=1 Tax=Paludibacterium yongneupense TaxID=400061 RepID=UPI0005630913|nr:TIGR00645 family protein [Paludibacterium yongneupense]